MYLDWETQAQDYYAIDIETDDLDATVVWVMCWENIWTGETGTCTTLDEIRAFFAATAGSFYVGHNIVKFDAPQLNKLAKTKLSVSKVVDTLILCMLYHPSIPGGHSLGEWGGRIGFPKFEFNDWTHLSDEMIRYCAQDVRVTAELFRRIVKVLNKVGFSERTCYIQHNITTILHRQQINGFHFDGPRAMLLYQQLRKREEELQDEIRRAFPAERREVRTGDCFTRSGQQRVIYQRDLERYRVEVSPDGRTYTAFEDVPFNIGSPKQRAEKLEALGWVAEERTPKSKAHPEGQPKVTEKSLVAFAEASGIPEVALITKWMSVNGRANMINTWLENWNEADSCIHGKLFVADTLRFRHQAPNTANIPAVRTSKDGVVLRGEDGYFTYEARDLWTARHGRVLVGTDAAGLELRMLAHFLNRADFTEQVVNGDPHQFNADLVGITRPNAKTLIYAALYGAGGPKVAKTLKVSNKEGARIRQLFLDRLGVQDLITECQAEQETGRVWLVDGAGVICPSPHAALNYKLQGSGARVMALGAVLLSKHIKRAGLDSLKVGDIHDEWQYDVAPDDAAEHARLSVLSIQQAGEELNLNVPLTGEAKQGLTWAETH
jgi:DNA polymerase-1